MNIFNVIVTYNRPKHLSALFDRLSRNNFTHIILVDNNSDKETDSVILKNKIRFEYFHLEKLRKNIGSSGGFRVGLKLFTQISGNHDFAITHDDDSWPSFDVSKLKYFVHENSKMKVGCLPVLYPDGNLNLMNIPGRSDYLNNLRKIINIRRPKTKTDFSNYQIFDYCSWVGFIIKKEAVLEVGFPSEKFFIYSDDTFYTMLCGRRFGGIANVNIDQMYFVHDSNRVTGAVLLGGRFGFYEVRNKIILLRAMSDFCYIFIFYYVLFLVCCRPLLFKVVFKGLMQGLTVDIKEYFPEKTA